MAATRPSRAKASPAKASPAKASPAKASPAKASPAEPSPAKASPAEASPARKSPARTAAAPAKAVPPAVAARADHKGQTRQALIDAALSLFAAKGYDATSVEEITEWAGVSPRTFFRYFETKDRVLFFGGDAFNHAVIRHLPDQPAELDELSALEATLVTLTPIVATLKPRIRLYYRAVMSSPTLLGQHTQAGAQHTDLVVQALAVRRSLRKPDRRCRLAAALAGVAMEEAYRSWLTSRRDLADLTTEAFSELRLIAAG